MGAQSSQSGSVAASRDYDAFGGVASSSGSWQGPFGTAGAFGYQTEASGLHLLGHRYYEPGTGRFVSDDPALDGSNWFVYARNNPVSNGDPSGRAPWTVLQALFGAAGLILGTIIGLVAMTMVFEALDPRYKAQDMISQIMLTVGLNTCQVIYGLAVSQDYAAVAKEDLGTMLRRFRNSLRQTGWSRHTGAFGIGFSIGLAMGVAFAVIAYQNLDGWGT